MSLKTPEKIRNLRKGLYEKAKAAPAFRFYLLYDKVYREDILDHAYRLARSNGGAPGVDGMTFGDIEAAGLEEWLASLREALRTETYQPSPVRRVLIPKPGGGQRPLGIPTIRDRVAQTAAKLVLEPIFEADLSDSAFGYREGRSAGGAVERVHRALCDGYTEVVDADLSQYLDTIPHDQLMPSIARRVSDGKMLRLIKAWLQTPVEETDERGHRRMTGGKGSRRGTPQGGVISPLLANIYLNRFLRVFQERGKDREFAARLVAYADDFVILSRGKAEPALAWTRCVLAAIGLTLNDTKTCIRNAREEHFDFLGYTFGPERYRKDGHWYLAAKPSKKSVQQLKGKVRTILRPSNQSPWPTVGKELNRLLRGWSNYFSYGTRLFAYRAVDNHVYERVRHFLRRRHKVPTRGTRRFDDDMIFGALGVLRLRTVHVGARP
ncbi:MAG: group II intron reverse transcriptase/maturase [Nitrospirota bacterium]